MLSYKKILVPVDFAGISKSAIAKAANHSEASNSELLVAHVVDRTAPHYKSHFAIDASSEIEMVVRQAEKNLDELLDKLEIGYCEKLVTEGEPVATLLKIIKEHGIDLVVMGTHHGVTSSEWVQSMTVEVVKHTECDVLVLHK